LDTDLFAEVLSDWLAEHNGSLPASLALDGKMIREVVGVVSLVDHETGVPVTWTPNEFEIAEPCQTPEMAGFALGAILGTARNSVTPSLLK
jgi:hypothetical protein